MQFLGDYRLPTPQIWCYCITKHMGKKPQDWRMVKAKIIVRFGTLGACAARLECSVEGLRSAVKGKCPGIWTRLQQELSTVVV
jgi:hypothetical protein